MRNPSACYLREGTAGTGRVPTRVHGTLEDGSSVRVSQGEVYMDMPLVEVTAERLEKAVSPESLEEDTWALSEERFRA